MLWNLFLSVPIHICKHIPDIFIIPALFNRLFYTVRDAHCFLSETTILIFLSASTWTRIISSYFHSCAPSLLLYKRHNHIVELLRPVGVEVCHLEPVGLIFNADVIQLNENLGRFDIVTTVPLERRAQR